MYGNMQHKTIILQTVLVDDDKRGNYTLRYSVLWNLVESPFTWDWMY